MVKKNALLLLLISASSSFSQVVIDFIGDCTIGNDVRWPIFDEYAGQKNYAYFFDSVKSVLAADDYTIANLETTVIDTGTPREKQFRFRAKPDYLNILKAGSVECVTIANNHSWDYGDSGYAQTARNLDKYGIDYFAYDKILRKEIKGLRFAFIGQSFFIQDSAVPAIKRLRDSVDFIVAVMHWGTERMYQPDAGQRAMARTLIDAGADLVVGHHPHVLQPVLKYRGKYVAYSLGNFVFGGNRNPRDKRTMILRVTFAKNAPITLQKIPCRISSVDTTNNFQPVLDPAPGKPQTDFSQR